MKGQVLRALVVAILCQGCIAIPYVSPPAKAEFNVGGVGGMLRHESNQPAQEKASEVLMGAHVGFYPLGLFPQFIHRSWDVGVGYVFESTLTHADPRSPHFHGIYLDADYWFLVKKLSKVRALRFGLLARGDARWASGPGLESTFGGSAFAGLTFEFSEWLGMTAYAEQSRKGDSGEDKDDGENLNLLGVSVGEGGVGASLGAGYTTVGDQEFWSVLFNVTFRIPGSAGVLIYIL